MTITVYNDDNEMKEIDNNAADDRTTVDVDDK